MSRPKYAIGDRVIVRDYGLFGDGSCAFTLKITEVFPNYGGPGHHRYYGDTNRGPRGAYENQLDGPAHTARKTS